MTGSDTKSQRIMSNEVVWCALRLGVEFQKLKNVVTNIDVIICEN